MNVFIAAAVILLFSYFAICEKKVIHKKSYPWSPPFNGSSANISGRVGEVSLREDSINADPMTLTRNDFNLNCNGQCFYYPEGCNPLELACTMIASIVEFSPNCEPGHVDGDTFMCHKNTKYFTVSLFRGVDNHYCNTQFDTSKNRRCIDREFVAFAFFDDGQDEINENDIWYLCASGEGAVTTWSGVFNKTAERVTDTVPWPSGGAGSMWSHIEFLEEDDSLVCVFILSTSHMRLNLNPSPEKTNSTGDNEFADTPVRVKMAQGMVKREDKTGRLLYPMISDLTNNRTESKYYAFPENVKLARIDVRSVVETVDITIDRSIKKKIDNIYNVCKDKKHIVCYTQVETEHCIKEKKCHILITIQRIAENLLRFHMIVMPNDNTSKRVKPYNWGSIGFVKNKKDLGDGAITFNCMAIENTANVVIGFNQGKNNININGSHQLKMTDKSYLIEPGGDRFMCSWTLSTSITIHLKETDENDKGYHYNLKEEHKVLLASGTRFFSDWTLMLHTYRDILEDKFKSDKLKINTMLDPTSSCCGKMYSIPNLLICTFSVVTIKIWKKFY